MKCQRPKRALFLFGGAMAKGAFFGVGGKAKKIKKIFVEVNGVARAVKKAYVGVNGKARLWWSGVCSLKASEYHFSSGQAEQRIMALSQTDPAGACEFFTHGGGVFCDEFGYFSKIGTLSASAGGLAQFAGDAWVKKVAVNVDGGNECAIVQGYNIQSKVSLLKTVTSAVATTMPDGAVAFLFGASPGERDSPSIYPDGRTALVPHPSEVTSGSLNAVASAFSSRSKKTYIVCKDSPKLFVVGTDGSFSTIALTVTPTDKTQGTGVELATFGFGTVLFTVGEQGTVSYKTAPFTTAYPNTLSMQTNDPRSYYPTTDCSQPSVTHISLYSGKFTKYDERTGTFSAIPVPKNLHVTAAKYKRAMPGYGGHVVGLNNANGTLESERFIYAES